MPGCGVSAHLLLFALLTALQLYNLYLEPANFAAVAYPLYIATASSNPIVRLTLCQQLRSAAEAELLQSASLIDVDDLYREAEKAFQALSILLGHDPWFFGHDTPTLFDASVFAYTHLLLDARFAWPQGKLGRALHRQSNLVQHRDRILEQYYT